MRLSRKMRRGNMALLVSIGLGLLVFGVATFLGPFIITTLSDTTNNTVIQELMTNIIGLYSLIVSMAKVIIVVAVGGAALYAIYRYIGRGNVAGV